MKYRYNWKLFPIVKEFLDKIYINTSCKIYDKKYVKELMASLEEYLIYFLGSDYFNIDHVVEKLDKIESIDAFYQFPVITEEGPANIPFKIEDNTLLLNNVIISDKKLTIKERRRLNLYVGLSHFLISLDNEETRNFSKIYSDIIDEDREGTEYLVNSGFKLIEDGLAQELGEKIAYWSLRKKRPGSRPGNEELDAFPVDGSLVSSNLEMYRLYSELIPLFGVTIGGMADYMNYDEKTVINNMIKEAVNKDLSHKIINEYIAEGNEFGLYQIMYLFGKLVNERNNQFEKTIVPERLDNKDTKEILQMLSTLFSGFVNLSGKSSTNDEEYEINKNAFVKKRLKEFINNKNI